MLLAYYMKNYKSFYDNTYFSMIPAPKLRQLSYSVLAKKVRHGTIKALCSSVIYGPNASGKTNLLGALEVLRGIVLGGSIRNKNLYTENFAVNRLELIPNLNSSQQQKDNPAPITLGVKALHAGVVFEYSIVFVCEDIIHTDVERKILEENLKINDALIFTRKDNKIKVSENIPPEYLNTLSGLQNVNKLANNVDKQEIFLTGNFKALYSKKISDIITEWFANKLFVVVDAERAAFIPHFAKESNALTDSMINKLARVFGSTANKLMYVKNNNDVAELYSVFPIDAKKSQAISAKVYESLGTRRLIDMAPAIIDALVSGKILLIDELDASLHPMAVMSIINAFHNDEINKNGAQLIFNTHNPIFLNKNIFRTDEIKFVDREDDTHFSEVYSLSDFGTVGSTRAKNTSNYMKNYFVNKYGALKAIDFTDILEDAVKTKHRSTRNE